jgi:hypothetical protein
MGENELDYIKTSCLLGSAAALVEALIAWTMVRIPRAVEKEHVQ